jgi:hypothetical protein
VDCPSTGKERLPQAPKQKKSSDLYRFLRRTAISSSSSQSSCVDGDWRFHSLRDITLLLTPPIVALQIKSLPTAWPSMIMRKGTTPAVVSKDVGSIMTVLAAVATFLMLCGFGEHHSVEAFVTPLTRVATPRALVTPPSSSPLQSTLFEQRATTASSSISAVCNKKIITSLTMMADDGDTVPPIYQSSTSTSNNNNVIPRDVIIVGGGLAGLSIALRIATTSARHVTIFHY